MKPDPFAIICITVFVIGLAGMLFGINGVLAVVVAAPILLIGRFFIDPYG